MKIVIPVKPESNGLAASDFEKYPIPLPPCDFKEEEGGLIIAFNSADEAVKYGLHLGDVHERMKGNTDHRSARKKIKLIISCINEQVDFTALDL